jgi:hypothetical protein
MLKQKFYAVLICFFLFASVFNVAFQQTVKAQYNYFGNTGIGNIGDDIMDESQGNTLLVINWTTPSDCYNITDIFFFIQSVSGTINATGEIYSETIQDRGSFVNQPFPYEWLANSSEIADISGPVWCDFSIPNGLTVLPNTDYWFGIQASGDFDISYNSASSTHVAVTDYNNTFITYPLTLNPFPDIPINVAFIGLQSMYMAYLPLISPTPTPTPTGLNIVSSLNSLVLTENIFSYLILLVIACLVMFLGLVNKYGALVAVPFGMIVAVYYLDNGLGWHFILLLFISMGIMDLAASGKIKG